MTTMAMTTNQKLAADPYLAWMLNELPDVKKWGANPESTEDEPRPYVEVYGGG
jgi:hypothetical protein